MGDQGPPPGGYGLHEPPKVEEPPPAPKPQLPPMAPFRTLPLLDAPQPRSRRWIGIPIIGIALFSIRMLLLCSRMNEPSYNYTYTPDYSPLTIPTMTYTPPVAPPVSLGAVATDEKGSTYFVKRGELWVQPKDEATPTWLYTGQGALQGVATFRNAPYTLERGDLMRVHDGGTADTLASGDFSAFTIDGGYAYLVGQSSIQKVALPDGKPQTIASTDPSSDADLHGPIVVAQGFVWFGFGEGVARIGAKTGHAIVGKPFAADIEMFAMAATPDAILVATDGGVLELSGGKKKALTPDDWDTACHDIVAAGKWVYVTYQDAAGWAVGRMARAGGSVDPVVHTVIEPHLAVKGGAVVYSTSEGIRSVPDPE